LINSYFNIQFYIIHKIGMNNTITFENEDDTLGCIMREQLLMNNNVIFSAYKVPHPLTKTVELRVITVNVPVKDVITESINTILTIVNDFDNKFNKSL